MDDIKPGTPTDIPAPVTQPGNAEMPAASLPPQQPSSPIAMPLPSVPPSWPGAFGIYKYSKAVIQFNLNTFVVLFLISAGAGALEIIPIAGQIAAIVIGLVLAISSILTQLAGIRGRHLSLGDAISGSWPLVLRILGLDIIVALSTAVGFLLLIVPGLIILPRLSLATYFLVDKNMGVMEAYKASWRATKGHAGKAWGIFGVVIVMVLPVITIVGILATVYFVFMYGAAFALLYETLTRNPTGGAPTPAAAVPQPPAQTPQAA